MKKKLLIVLMIALALVVVATVTGVFQQQDVLSMDYPEVNIPTDEVHTIRIETAERRMILEKSDDGWYITRPIEAPIEDPLIEGFLRRLSDFDIEGVLTAEESRYAEYGVTPELGRQVEIEWDGGDVEFLVAGNDVNYQEGYVRIGRDPRVFYLGRRMPIVDDPQSWRDKRIVHFEPSDITSITVAGRNRGYTVHRADDGKLSIEPDASIDSSLVARLFTRYESLRTDVFDDGQVDPDDVRETPDLTVVIRHDKVGTPGETTIWWKQVVGYYAVVREDDTVFLVTSPRISSLVPERSALLAGEG